MKFSDLNLSKPLLRALEDLQLEQATPIQEKSFPVLMSGRDAVGIAQTGTGKTYAYLLPVLRQLDYSEQRHPRVLILVPTRELVEQLCEEIKKLSAYMSLRVTGIYGASNINTQRARVQEGQDIVVATPGRLIDLLNSFSIQVNSVKKLVIDEVDEMLNLGFRAQLMQVLERLPVKRQNILFSATLTEDVEALIRTYFNAPEFIEVIARGTPLQNINQLAYKVPNFYTKINLLRWLLKTDAAIERALLFTKNKIIADLIESELADLADQIGVIHSNKSQPHRFEMVRRFQRNELRLLIATDVIARGLDLSNVSHVINFDLPSTPDTYIHRIGRTGRADRRGEAISFITPADAAAVQATESLMKMELAAFELPEDVAVSEDLIEEEVPKVKVRMKKPAALPETGGAFHEKKGKNKKIQLGGKRRQEKQRRAIAKSRSKRKR